MSAAMSGICVSDACLSAFDDVKKRKKHRYIIFGIEGDQVVVRSQGERSATYDAFVKSLKTDEPAYIVFDFEYERNGVMTSKLIFICWVPDQGSMRQKMIYASTKESLKAKIDGGLVEIQACDLSEVSEAEVKARVTKF